MNQKERLLTALKGGVPDRVPNFEVWWVGHPQIESHFLGHPIKNEEDLVKFSRNIGWGSADGGYFGLSQGTYEEASDGAEHYTGGTWKSWKDYEKLNIPLNLLEEKLTRLKKIYQMARNEGLATHIYILSSFHATCTSMHFEHFALTCYDDLDLIEAFMEKVEEYNCIALKMVLNEVKPDFVIFDNDCAYKNGLMVSPELFEKIWFKRTKKTVEILKENDIIYMMHTDGKVDEVMPFLIKLGFCALHGVEKQANDLREIKEKFGREVSLIGNMDIVDLTKKSPAEIEEETGKMLARGKPGGGYIAGCNTSVAGYIPTENYLAMLKTIEKFGWYE